MKILKSFASAKKLKTTNVFIIEDERREKSTWENYSKSLQSRKEFKIQHKTSWHTKKSIYHFMDFFAALLSSKSLCCQIIWLKRSSFGKFYDLSTNSSFVFLANDVKWRCEFCAANNLRIHHFVWENISLKDKHEKVIIHDITICKSCFISVWTGLDEEFWSLRWDSGFIRWRCWLDTEDILQF